MRKSHYCSGLLSVGQLFKDRQFSLKEFLGLVMKGLVKTYDRDARIKNIHDELENLVNTEYEKYLVSLPSGEKGIENLNISIYEKIEKIAGMDAGNFSPEMEYFVYIDSFFTFIDTMQLPDALRMLGNFLNEERAERGKLNADTPVMYVYISISRLLIGTMGIDISLAKTGRGSTDIIRRALKKIGEEMEDDTIRRVRRVLCSMEPPGKGPKAEASFRKIFLALLHRRKEQGGKTAEELKDEICLGLDIDKSLLDVVFTEYQKHMENL